METTRRYSRTLNEAFGPYAHGSQFQEYEPTPKADRIVLIASLIGFAAVGVFALVGWL